MRLYFRRRVRLLFEVFAGNSGNTAQARARKWHEERRKESFELDPEACTHMDRGSREMQRLSTAAAVHARCIKSP